MRRCVPLYAVLVSSALAACSQAPAPAATTPEADAAAATTPVTADTAPVPSAAAQSAWQALLAKMDRDGDGVIARPEHAIAAAVMFSRMDRDGDDAVTVEEMDSQREQLLATAPTDTARRLAEVDTNHDGSLDSREHDAATRVVFDRYDRNADAKLTRDEFLQALAQLEAAGPAASAGSAAN